MTDHDDLLAEIGSNLDLEPSREFAAGVHTLVRKDRRRAVTIRWALATAASIGLVSFLVWRPSVQHADTTPLIPVPASPVTVATTAATPAAPVRVAAPLVGIPRVAPVAVKAVSEERTEQTTGELRLEVITNQGEVLRALWASYDRAPRSVLVVDTAASENASTKPIVVEPIVVPSIVVKELGVEPGRPGRNDASQIIRRFNATGDKK